MPLGTQELRRPGYIGVVVFWLRITVLGICVASAVLSVYWVILTSARMWLKGCGPSILIASIFLALLSLAAGVFLFLSWLGKDLCFERSSLHIYGILSIVSLILCCALMSFSTETSSLDYYKDLDDYLVRNKEDSHVKLFREDLKLNESRSEKYTIEQWVRKRSGDVYPSIASLFGIWLPCTVVYLICIAILGNEKQPEDLEQLTSEANKGTQPAAVAAPPGPNPAVYPNPGYPGVAGGGQFPLAGNQSVPPAPGYAWNAQPGMADPRQAVVGGSQEASYSYE